MSVYQTIAVIVILLFLLVGPVCFFMLKHKLVKHFTFRNARKVTNHTGLIYICIWCLMLLYALVSSENLMNLPDFLGPDNADILLAICIYFGSAAFLYYLPVAIVVNAVFFIRTRFYKGSNIVDKKFTIKL